MDLKIKVFVFRKGTQILVLTIFFMINLLGKSFAQDRLYVEQTNILDDFNTDAYLKASIDEFLFGGINGVNSFKPSDLKRIHNMDYTNPKKNRFRYKLSGIDEQWVEIGTTPSINFSNFDYGDYTLLVSSTWDGENWSEPVSLRIVIATPFFRTWYAILLYILAIIGAIWWLNQTKVQRIISDQKLINEQNKIERLKELDTLKTTFFTNISHEFRTPLTLILGVSDLFVYKDSESQQNISVIKRNANKLMDMINEILDLGKLEARKIEPNLSEINLRGFLEELMLFFNAYGISKQVTLTVELPSDQLMVMVDEDLLERIITNLIRNAFKFSKDKGQVKLKVSVVETAITQLNDEIEIIVSDNGIGLSEVDLPHVFDRFHQIDSNRRVEGSSIGLALVKEMVSMLKGSISIKSKINEGTEVYVKLPLIKMWLSQDKASVILKEFPQERIFSPAKNAQEKLVKYQKEQNLLLIVDDNADMRNYVNRVFKDSFQIIQASNAIDGLALAHAQVPDLIISDLMMPEMDGHEFCKNIKSDVATSHIPFILLTANVSKEARLEAFECGVDDCLTKPFDLEEIVTRVNNLIAQRERLQKIYSDKIFSSNQPPVPSYSFDDLFLNKARLMVEHNLGNADFGVEQFSEKMNISTSQLLRKLKALTSLTTVEFLRDLRLQKSTELLMQQDGNIIEISEQVGFNNPSYFAKIFQEKYGISPSNFRK